MAKTREQFMVGIVVATEMFWDKKNRLCFREQNFYDVTKRSCKVPVSECRIFRRECQGYEEKAKLIRDEFGRLQRDKSGDPLMEFVKIRSAREFVVVDFKRCKQTMKIKRALRRGFVFIDMAGNETLFRRVSRSAAKARTKKALFTSKDPHEVRHRCSYGAKFEEREVISKMESRYGLPESSSIEIKLVPTIDVLPDYSIRRKHNVEIYDVETQTLKLIENFEKDYEPLDGQGTILPAYAVKVSHELQLISARERDYLIRALEKQPDPRVLVAEDEKFAKLWKKIPAGFLIRFGFAKGFLVVYPHNLEKTDCHGRNYRESGKVMKFWEEDRHYYNFNADILFTDSMWKANFDKKYITDEVPYEERAKLEVVLWSKAPKGRIYMGYQYWQALKPEVNPATFAKAKIDELRDTIFVNADEAKAFLGCIDNTMDPDAYEENMTKAGTKIQKILEILNENPEMIREQYIQRSLREMREEYVRQMHNGRIPIEGANPFIITAPELMFGHQSNLEAGQSYYNGTVKRYAAFRSPLIHRSEAVVINTVEVPEYDGLYRDLLVLNPYDDTLPRMGGADTDGDRVALVDNEEIVNGVYTDLPMLYDAGADAEKQVVSDEAIFEFDYATIVSDAPTIGEVTNMSTTWKDIMENPAMMEELEMTEHDIDTLVKILRFMQGWAIDYAKTGYFPPVPAEVQISMSPDWHPWSQGAVNAGIEGAEVYESASKLGRLHRAIKKYLDNKYYAPASQSSSRDFTFEFASAADYEEVERIKPIIATLERSYRHELDFANQLELDEEQRREYVSYVVDKYQRAVASIDADIATIAAAAYQHTYYENGTKGKSISFPWVTCYEGLLLNASQSNDVKTKLRVARYDGHLDDIPATLKFYQCESKGEHYVVQCKVPNGTYETFRKNGVLYIKTKARANSRLKKVDQLVPEQKHLPLEIVGFKANGLTAKQALDLMHAVGGELTIKAVRDNDNGEVRAAVFAGKQRIGSVAKQHKSLVANLLPCRIKVNNLNALNPVYLAKGGTKQDASFYAIDAIYLGAVEKKAAEKPKQEAPIELEPSIPQFKPEILEAINTDAPYWNLDVDPRDLNIIGVAVKQIGAIKVGEVCAEVIITNRKGQQRVFKIQAVPGKRFAIAGEPIREDAAACILQISHHELYRMYLDRQKAMNE